MKKVYHPERDFPYIDMDGMDDKDLVIVKESEFDKAMKFLLKVLVEEKTKKKKNNNFYLFGAKMYIVTKIIIYHGKYTRMIG
jgi:hypothetical protein